MSESDIIGLLIDLKGEVEEQPQEVSIAQNIDIHLKRIEKLDILRNGLKRRMAELKDEIALLDAREDMYRQFIGWGLQSLGLSKVSLPGVGTARLQNKAESIEVTDETEAIAWALKHAPEMVVHEPRLAKAPYKTLAMERLKADGEVIPGTTPKPATKVLVIKGGA